MRKQRRQELITYVATGGVIMVAAVLWSSIDRNSNSGFLTSREVDNLLYERLNGYERAFEQAPDLARLLNQAMTDPEQMTLDDRREYLSHERRFFSGWEAAYEYLRSGDLEPERFDVWDEWYVNELRRRPDFAWDENRQYFSEQFVAHVDRVMQEP